MLITPSDDNQFYQLYSPTIMPKASGFLWNNLLMINMNCRGFATAQFMQPEPCKYSHVPTIEAKTFMQPEQPYFAHHPGRFFYIKDEDNGDLFSVPYEPVKQKHDSFIFSAGKSSIKWDINHLNLQIEVILRLPVNEPLEMWEFKIKSNSENVRNISIYPYFPVGYMSWMNQSGYFDKELESVICSSITPYQKYKEYEKIKELKDKTFLIPDKTPTSWEVNQNNFEGEGGLNNPDALKSDLLKKGEANYEIPACILQYKITLTKEQKCFRFLFGPAKNREEIIDIKNNFFNKVDSNNLYGFTRKISEYQNYINSGNGVIKIKTPDDQFNNFVNNWLPRQMYYHGITNRLSTDPQTRNYLQDNMGMSYVNPQITRNAILTALSQQHFNGEMPDGVLIHKDAELKYINQVPHTDHCLWLPIALSTYLNETDDYGILNEKIKYGDNSIEEKLSVHMNKAMDWLINTRDNRGLNYINQGDWCDPMNMVGYKGKGVSAWLTIASSYAFKLWSEICTINGDQKSAEYYKEAVKITNNSANKHLWDGNWYIRGITDDNIKFGVSSDTQGRIFLNPQGFALLGGTADIEKEKRILNSVKEFLETPYGVQMFSPAYTSMREDVGRVTQKFPGTAENGSVYNHAAAFYIYGLYNISQADEAFRLLRKMIPGYSQEDSIIRGQLPIFIPNYYRGAYSQFPENAGKSSHLFNTGTATWVYKCLIDGMFGITGCREGLKVKPNLPTNWSKASVVRDFRGAILDIEYIRCNTKELQIYVDGVLISGTVIKGIKKGKKYKVIIKV